jgi:Domain of unknown function (DUF4126)
VDTHDLALAYTLSAVAGLRATMTVLTLAIAIHVHALQAPPDLAWLASDTTLWIAAVVALCDLLGDKVPLLDHALHAVHTLLAPVAGGVAVLSVNPTHATDPTTLALAAGLGGVNALGVHGLRATTRLASTSTSFGALNPFLSAAGDVAAVVALAGSFLAPLATAFAILAVTLLAIVAGRRVARAVQRRRATPSAQS